MLVVVLGAGLVRVENMRDMGCSGCVNQISCLEHLSSLFHTIVMPNLHQVAVLTVALQRYLAWARTLDRESGLGALLCIPEGLTPQQKVCAMVENDQPHGALCAQDTFHADDLHNWLVYQNPPHTQNAPVHLFADATKTLSIVMPAYNEDGRIQSTLLETLSYLERRRDREGPSFTYEVVVVDDGSRDNTTKYGEVEECS